MTIIRWSHLLKTTGNQIRFSERIDFASLSNSCRTVILIVIKLDRKIFVGLLAIKINSKRIALQRDFSTI